MDRSASSHLAFSVILRVPGEWGTRGHYSEFRFAHNTDSSKLRVSDFEDFKKSLFGATWNLLCLHKRCFTVMSFPLKDSCENLQYSELWESRQRVCKPGLLPAAPIPLQVLGLSTCRFYAWGPLPRSYDQMTLCHLDQQQCHYCFREESRETHSQSGICITNSHYKFLYYFYFVRFATVTLLL